MYCIYVYMNNYTGSLSQGEAEPTVSCISVGSWGIPMGRSKIQNGRQGQGFGVSRRHRLPLRGNSYHGAIREMNPIYDRLLHIKSPQRNRFCTFHRFSESFGRHGYSHCVAKVSERW